MTEGKFMAEWYQDLGYLLVVAVLYIGLHAHRMNAAEEERHRQVGPLLFTLLSAVAVLYFYYEQGDVFRSVKDGMWILEWFPWVYDHVIHPAETLVDHWLNLLMFLGVFGFKGAWKINDKLLLPLMEKVKYRVGGQSDREGNPLSFLANLFYHEVEGKVVLRQECNRLSEILYRASYLFFFWMLFLYAADLFGWLDKPEWKNIAYSLLALPTLVTLEMALFLDGSHDESSARRSLVGSGEEEKVRAYDRLFDDYAKRFKPLILAKMKVAGSGAMESIDGKTPPAAFSGGTEKGEIAAVIAKIGQETGRIEPDCKMALEKLTNREDCILCNVNTRVFSPYFRSFVETLFMQNRKMLMVVATVEEKTEAQKWLRHELFNTPYGFRDVNGYLAERLDEPVIILDHVDEVYESFLKEENFSSQWDLVYFPDLKKMIQLHRFRASLLFYRIRDLSGSFPQFFATSQYVQDIDVVAGHWFPSLRHDKKAIKVDESPAREYLAVVKRESEKRYQAFYQEDARSEQFGKELALGLPAWKEGVDSLILFAPRSPMKKEMEQANHVYGNRHALLPLEQAVLDLESPFFSTKEGDFLVVYDEYNNMAATVKKWRTVLPIFFGNTWPPTWSFSSIVNISLSCFPNLPIPEQKTFSCSWNG